MPHTAPGKVSCKGMDLERERIKKEEKNFKTFQSSVENGGADTSDRSSSQTSYSVIQLSG